MVYHTNNYVEYKYFWNSFVSGWYKKYRMIIKIETETPFLVHKTILIIIDGHWQSRSTVRFVRHENVFALKKI